MAMSTPAQAAAAWQTGMQNSTQKIQAGVNAVTVAPTQAAAAAADRMLAGIQRAVSSGKWQASLQAVSLQDWKTAMLDKGVNRIATGAAAAKNKVQAFLTQFLPYVAQGKQQLDATMPRGDLEQNIARAAYMMRHNAQFRKS